MKTQTINHAKTSQNDVQELQHITKKIPIIAGMKFQYPNIGSTKLHKIGYKIMVFVYTNEWQLIEEYEKKRVIYK